MTLHKHNINLLDTETMNIDIKVGGTLGVLGAAVIADATFDASDITATFKRGYRTADPNIVVFADAESDGLEEATVSNAEIKLLDFDLNSKPCEIVRITLLAGADFNGILRFIQT